jgi:hypothetical protein
MHPCEGVFCTGRWFQLVQMPSFVPGSKIPSTNEKSGQGQMSNSLVLVAPVECKIFKKK